MNKYQKIIGNKISLATVDVNEADLFASLVNDKTIGRNTGGWHYNFSYKAEVDFLSNIKSSDHNYAIVIKETNETIGMIGLKDIDYKNQNCMFGVFIGNDKDRGKGYGFEAISLMCDYTFNYLNINNISLHVYSFNEYAKKCYEKVGFKEVGRLRQAYFCDGKRHDTIIMDLLRDEFNDLNPFSSTKN